MKQNIKVGKLRIFVEIFRALNWTLGELKKYKWRLNLYIILLVMQALYEIFLTSQIGNIVDLALEDEIQKLVVTVIYFIFLYVLNISISILTNRISAYNYNGMYNDLELKMYRKIMDSSWEELTEYHSGDLITRLSTDIKTLAGNTSGLVPTMISRLTLVICAGIYIIVMDFSMVLVAMVIAPIIVIASRIFMGRILESQKKIREIESSINSYNKETFNNIQAVKAFGLGDLFYSKMCNLEVERKKLDLKSNQYSLLSWAVSFFTGIVGGIICLGWMFYRVHIGVLSFGKLSVMAFLAVQVGTSVKTLLNLVPTIMDYVASYERVKILLEINDEESYNSLEGIEDFIKNNNGIAIKISNMFFKYKNGYSVFENVTLEANPGEIVALVGPSGEGKTTMLRIILGIVTAKKGCVVAQNESGEMRLGKLTRQFISYVPQGNTMMAGTIIDNLRMIKHDATEKEIEDVLKTACIYDFVKKLPDGLNHMLGENGLGFSEGQNQRLSIARALLKDSPVILMDEATSALDVATERRILDNIMKKDPRKTVVLTTHRPTVLTMCDRVYRIADKKVNIIGQQDIEKLLDEF